MINSVHCCVGRRWILKDIAAKTGFGIGWRSFSVVVIVVLNLSLFFENSISYIFTTLFYVYIIKKKSML